MKINTYMIKRPEQLDDIDHRLIDKFASTLRKEDRSEMSMFNIVEHSTVVACLQQHIRTSERALMAFFDDEPAVMAGVIVRPGIIPSLWLGTTDVVNRYKKSYVRWVKEHDVELRRMYPQVAVAASADYIGAVRLLELIGFTARDRSRYREFVRVE